MIGWRRILSLLVVLVLVISGFAVFSSSLAVGEDGEQLHTVNIEVNLDVEAGVGAVYEGKLDLFMHQVDGETYQGLPRKWREELETWEARTSFNNLFINPAREGSGTAPMQDA
ncbi:MAG: hypothetical protein V5A88_08270, partial [Candidatus Thermoplasmatota archaeon]